MLGGGGWVTMTIAVTDGSVAAATMSLCGAQVVGWSGVWVRASHVEACRLLVD